MKMSQKIVIARIFCFVSIHVMSDHGYHNFLSYVALCNGSLFTIPFYLVLSSIYTSSLGRLLAVFLPLLPSLWTVAIKFSRPFFLIAGPRNFNGLFPVLMHNCPGFHFPQNFIAYMLHPWYSWYPSREPH